MKGIHLFQTCDLLFVYHAIPNMNLAGSNLSYFLVQTSGFRDLLAAFCISEFESDHSCGDEGT